MAKRVRKPKRPKIPGAVEHRKRFKERQKAGLVATNPKTGTPVPPQPVPRAPISPGTRGRSLAEQLGLKITPTAKIAAKVARVAEAMDTAPPPPEPEVVPEAPQPAAVEASPAVDGGDELETLMAQEPTAEPTEPVNYAEALPSSDVDAAEALLSGEEDTEDDERPEA